MEIIKRIVDGSEFQEYKASYGKTLLCGTGRIDGWAVGIVANQRKVVKTKKGEMQMGGVIYSDSADKAARFIMNCNQRKIPMLFLQDVSGLMVGSKAEHGGIIKDGAKMVNAMANSTVPKFTVIIGNSYGAGNYAMCGKAYDPRLIYALPDGTNRRNERGCCGKDVIADKSKWPESAGQRNFERRRGKSFKRNHRPLQRSVESILCCVPSMDRWSDRSAGNEKSYFHGDRSGKSRNRRKI